MTKQQKAEVLEIIRNDCSIACMYAKKTDDKVLTCVIGALAMAAGTSFEDLNRMCSACINMDCMNDVRVAILDKFDLSFQQQSALQTLNDNVRGTDEYAINRRRANCISFVENLDTVN